MSLLGSIASGLGGLAGPAIQAAGGAEAAQQAGQFQANQMRNQQLMTAIELARQQRELALKEMLNTAQAQEAQSRSNLLNQQATPEFYLNKSAAEEAGKFPYAIQQMREKGQIDEATAEKLAALHHQYSSQEIGQRGGIEQGLQNSKNQFEAKQQANKQQFEGQQNVVKQAGETASKLAGIQAQQGGSILTNVGRKLHILPQASAPITPGSVNAAGVHINDRVQQLHGLGLSDDAIRAQLVHEGYNPDAPAGGTTDTPNGGVTP